MSTKILIINLTELLSIDKGQSDRYLADQLFNHCCDVASIGHWPENGVTLSELREAINAAPCFHGYLSEYLFIGSRQAIMDAPWLDEGFAYSVRSAISSCYGPDPGHMFWRNTDVAPDISLAVPGLSARR